MCVVPYLELNLVPVPFSNGASKMLPGNGAGLGAGVLATAREKGNRLKGAGRQLRRAGSCIAKPQQGNSRFASVQWRSGSVSVSPGTQEN